MHLYLFFLPHQVIIYSVHYSIFSSLHLFCAAIHLFVIRVPFDFSLLASFDLFLLCGAFNIHTHTHGINDYTLLIGVSMCSFLFFSFLFFLLLLLPHCTFYMLMCMPHFTVHAHTLGGVSIAHLI